MKERYKLFINSIEEGKYSGREILMSGVILFLAGILLGIIISPRKNQTIGSNNGCYNTYTPDLEDEMEEDN